MSLMEQARLRLAGMEAPLVLALLGLFCGVFAGIVIVIFRLYTDAVVLIWFQDLNRAQDFESLPWQLRLALPILGGLIIGIVFHLLPAHLRSIGVRHVVERLAKHEGHLPLKNALVQFFSGGLALACGLPVGREGPAIHLGSAVSSMTGTQLQLPNNSQRILVGCGTAAAIGACFNTPLAGVVFALEVVMMEYSIASFIPIILSAVASTLISRLAFGNNVAYSSPELLMVSYWDIPAVVLLGLLGGVWSAGFIGLTEKVALKTDKWPRWVRPSIGGIIVGGIALFIPEIMGPGYDTVNLSFNGELGFTVLLMAFLGKSLASALCGGLSVPGGAIGPSLFIGATMGGLFGYGIDAISPSEHSSVGFYAMIGLATLMSATLYAPLAALMALLELTGNPNIILPGMLSVVLANLVVSHAFHKRSIIQTMLAVRGVETRVSPLTTLLRRVSLGTVLDTSFKIVDRKLHRVDAEALLKLEPRWMLVRENSWPKVLMHANDLAAYLLDKEDDEIDLLEIPGTRENVVSTHLQATLAEALENMNQHNVDAAYVYHRGGTDRIVGVVTRGRIEHYYTFNPH